MTRITAFLANEADPNLIRKIIENVKGVIATSIYFPEENKDESKETESVLTPEKQQWLDKLNRLYDNVDREAIDLNDEKTRYILSK